MIINLTNTPDEGKQGPHKAAILIAVLIGLFVVAIEGKELISTHQSPIEDTISVSTMLPERVFKLTLSDASIVQVTMCCPTNTQFTGIYRQLFKAFRTLNCQGYTETKELVHAEILRAWPEIKELKLGDCY